MNRFTGELMVRSVQWFEERRLLEKNTIHRTIEPPVYGEGKIQPDNHEHTLPD